MAGDRTNGAKAAAFFDLDGTLTSENTDMIASNARIRAGRYPLLPMARGIVAYGLYAMGLLSITQIKRAYISGGFRGQREEEMLAFSRELYRTRFRSILHGEALDALDALRAEGFHTYLVSASTYTSVVQLAENLGFDGYFATRAEVDDDGVYTGRLIPPVHSAEQKAVTVREVAEREGYDLAECHAFGDSMDDVFMLECVGHPTAVNPKGELLDIATRRGWRIVEWSRTGGR